MLPTLVQVSFHLAGLFSSILYPHVFCLTLYLPLYACFASPFVFTSWLLPSPSPCPGLPLVDPPVHFPISFYLGMSHNIYLSFLFHSSALSCSSHGQNVLTPLVTCLITCTRCQLFCQSDNQLGSPPFMNSHPFT